MAGRATPATRVAADAGVAHRVLAYDHDPRAGGYGEEAVAALGADPERVCKTLVARADDGRLLCAVLPVAARLDPKALARAAGAKRTELAEAAEAERATGYVAGGISPLGQRRALPTVVDAAAAAAPSVLVSAGRRGLELELAGEDLVALTGAVVAPIGRA